EAEDYFRQIESMGGVLVGIENGFFQREIADAAYVFQQEVDRKQRLIVGVNAFVDENEEKIPILRINPALEKEQVERVRAVRAERDDVRVRAALGAVERAASVGTNLMPPILDAVRAYASEGEIVEAMRAVFGSYREAAVF
ncbi:Methylmalonyl-CoA mutase, alpha and beta chain, catalytic domain protein, partial [mine drainage metagenome]